MQFTKAHGCGNDFMIIDQDAQRAPSQVGLSTLIERAPTLCDRHRGVGADGLLVLRSLKPESSEAPHYEMVVINADGSVAEMCGNGLRCVAHYLHKRGRLTEGGLLKTGAGDIALHFKSSREGGAVSEGAELACAEGWVGALLAPPREVVARALSAQGLPRALPFVSVSLGNPHAVTFDPAALSGRLSLVEPLTGLFPEGINLSFARLMGPGRVELFVHERGCGWTQACGTGACAAVIAAVTLGLATRGEALQVSLPGGSLSITWSERGGLEMWGPAVEVYSGEVLI